MSQATRLMRRMAGRSGQVTTPGGLYLPQGAWGPQDEQDAKRDRLAERLLEIGLEETCIESFTDTHRREQITGKEYDTERASLTLREWYVKHAEAALAAAEVIYPELPESQAVGSQPLPESAQAGAQSVGGFVEQPTQLGKDLASVGLEG